MLQDLAGEFETRVGRDRASSFRGTSLIRFEHLEFAHKPKEAKTKRLIKIMRTEGCLRLEPLNRIKAYIKGEDLDRAITSSGTTQHELFTSQNGIVPPLRFPEDVRVLCSKGASRIEAAKKVLCSEDHEWAIELFLTDATSELRKVFTDRTLNDGPLEDLEIYFNIRRAQSDQDKLAEGRWRVRLPDFKRRYLNQFLKHEQLVSAVDRVLRMPGQRFGMTMSTIHEFLGSKCYEEILYYLQRIDRVWSSIFEYNEELICQVDRDTVEATQFRILIRSPVDREYLETLVESRIILTFVADNGTKERILNNFLQIGSLILSMQSLGQDTKVLGFHARYLTRLFGDSEESLRSRLQQSFKGTNQRSGYIRVQESEFVLREHEGSVETGVDFGITQLWLFLGRHFTRHAKQIPQRESPIIWHRFATLAHQLGFESGQIHELLSDDPQEKTAGAWLLETRPSPEYEYDAHQFERFKKQMAHMVTQAREVPRPDNSTQPILDRNGKSPQRRCSRAFQDAFEYNRTHLFLRSLFEHSSVIDQDASSLHVVVSMYKAFLGDLLEPNTVGRPGAQGGLGTPGSLVMALSRVQNREESVSSEVEETEGRTEVDETLSIYSRVDNPKDHVLSNANSQLIAQVAELQDRIHNLQQQLHSQKRCNDELLEHATDVQTRERLLQAQVQDLEAQLFKSKELQEQWLAEHLHKADREEERKGFQEVEDKLRTVETELEGVRYTLNSTTLERDRLIRVSQEHASQMNTLEQQNTESQTRLKELRTQSTTKAIALSNEIEGLKSENDDLRTKYHAQKIMLEQSDQTIEELHATKIRMESSLKAELNFKHQNNYAEVSEMRSDSMHTNQHSDCRFQESESQLLGHENPCQYVHPSQKPPQLSFAQDSVDIHFEFQEEDGSRARKRTQKMSSAELKRMLQKGQRKGVYPMTKTGRALDPESAWDDVVNDGTYTVIEARMSKAAFLDEASRPPATPSEHVTSAEKAMREQTSSLQPVGQGTRPSGRTTHRQRVITDMNSRRDMTAHSSKQLGNFRLNRQGEPNFAKGGQQLGKE